MATAHIIGRKLFDDSFLRSKYFFSTQDSFSTCIKGTSRKKMAAEKHDDNENGVDLKNVCLYEKKVLRNKANIHE